jgi:outer membrane immunogenic protein
MNTVALAHSRFYLRHFLAMTIFAIAMSSSMSAHATSIEDLGGNKELIRRARALDPDNKIRVVQNRTVDRTWRVELGMNYGMVAGGDPYVNTQNLGGNLDVHVNPMFSVGARYYEHFNELTPEGRRIYDSARKEAVSGQPYQKTDIDYPLNSTLGVVSFYPIYGKLNFFDLGLAQFDLYVLGGYGQVQLESGNSPTWTAGGGVGLWLNQHLTTRLEVRYQNYEDEISTGTRSLNMVVSHLSIGLLL